jgi:hypothetical protein
LTTFETVGADTPASRAMSAMVKARCGARGALARLVPAMARSVTFGVGPETFGGTVHP